MKLLPALQKILFLEINRRSPVLSSFMYNGELVTLKSSYHQSFERNGNYDYEQTVDFYYDMTEKNPRYRIGVPNTMIRDVFNEKFIKIDKSFSEMKFSENRIIFVANNKYQEPDFDFQYLEFILQKENNNYTIVTSAFSEDGNFLFNFKRTKKIRLSEKYYKSEMKVVFL